MKCRSFSLFWLSLLFCVFILPSCFIGEKSKTKKVTGTWLRINSEDKNAEDEYWQFEDGTFTRLRGLALVKTDSAQYFIQQKLSKAFLNIDYGNDLTAVPNAVWEILKLNKKIMILEKTDGGTVLREFEKE